MSAYKITAVSIMIFVTLLIMVTPAFAINPQFGRVRVSGPDDLGNLTVDYNAHGIYYPPLGATVFGSRDTIFACKPPIGNFPPNPVQIEVIDTVYSGGGSTCEHNTCIGSILIQSLTTTLTCEPGMVPTLAMITYTDLNIGGIFGDFQSLMKKINGTYSATYYGYTP